jgi:hypothetical protein
MHRKGRKLNKKRKIGKGKINYDKTRMKRENMRKKGNVNV